MTAKGQQQATAVTSAAERPATSPHRPVHPTRCEAAGEACAEVSHWMLGVGTQVTGGERSRLDPVIASFENRDEMEKRIDRQVSSSS